ncbi:hypothetical protein ES705_11213 [subsurface metagenome]
MSIFNKNEEPRQGATGNWYTMAIIDGLIPIKPNIKIKARAYLSAVQHNLVSGDWTKVLLDTENYDIGSNFDPVTNHRLTVPITGFYLLIGQVSFDLVIANKKYYAKIYKNGTTAICVGSNQASFVDYLYVLTSDIAYLEADDFIELWGRQDSGVNTVDIYNFSPNTYMAIHLLSV